MIGRGDRVRLTPKAAAAAKLAMKNGGYVRRTPARDWVVERGTVWHTPQPGSACVVIRWDSAKSCQSWPRGAIELVNEIVEVRR